MGISSNSLLQTLSGEIEQLAEKAGRSVVSIGSGGRTGSGVVWDKNIVVTAYHVVSGLDEVEIRTEEGKALTAKMLGHLPHSDLAVLSVETQLSPIEKGDSENLRNGQFVLALANPFASRTSVTSGIITSARRTISDYCGTTIENAIVTDARVNPGYSGGPLVDASGKLIGLNIAYVSARGIAIPVNSISYAVSRIVSGQPFRKAYLGIISNQIKLPANVSSDPKVEQDSGLIILAVEDDTPAKEAGLLLGDVILRFNESHTSNSRELTHLLNEEAIGRPSKILILRGGKVTEVTITPTGKEE